LLDDAILLGEVVHARRDTSGWLAGVAVRQSLAPLGSLRRLIAVLTDGWAVRSGRAEGVYPDHDRDDQHRGQSHPQDDPGRVSPTPSAEPRLDQIPYHAGLPN
jgi:hypothetical protein